MSAERIASGFEASAPEGVSPRFVGLDAPSKKRSPSGQHTCQGLYWTLEGKTPTVAFVATHYNADFSEHYLASHLAAKGYGFLGWNTRFRGLEDLFILEPALEDIGVGVRWLKEVAGVQKVILIGNSGGGSLMAAYHAKSQDDGSLVKADAFIFVNSHTGRPDVFSNWLDPAVIDEDDPVKTDTTLDMYNPANGPPYSQEFINRYRAAQIERNHRITEWVKKELQRLNDAGIPDRLFPIHRTMADLRFTIILQTAIATAADGRLRFIPIRQLQCIMSAFVFLFKAITLCTSREDVQTSLVAMERCVKALGEADMDEMNVSRDTLGFLYSYVRRLGEDTNVFFASSTDSDRAMDTQVMQGLSESPAVVDAMAASQPLLLGVNWNQDMFAIIGLPADLAMPWSPLDSSGRLIAADPLWQSIGSPWDASG
ncbi:alpha beta hydrolase [Fusarium langsethiae]|uniref:Alpha beta hydrolase n=1 Tax=Fusarium langsethiae TaxID=179993 RepID=A0A0M9EMN3_FUSLA|nr:alpha beta hydrolase [Fusarium langsethiae]GKU10197.1 unnamed protein product [Fusarium langsethiae]